MSQETAEKSPALAASQSSWRCVQAHDREGWLALMADDVVVEDPIGKSVTNPDGTGVRGKDGVAEFYDTNIAANQSADHLRGDVSVQRPQRGRAYLGAGQQV